MQGIIDEEVDKMLAEGVIEPSGSPWSSPIVLAKKKDGKYRFCIDFRKVNEVTRKDAYPLPFINVILDKLRRARYISTIDLKSGYWQVPDPGQQTDHRLYGPVPGAVPIPSHAVRTTFGASHLPAPNGPGHRARVGSVLLRVPG
jgi:hypothetical protein